MADLAQFSKEILRLAVTVDENVDLAVRKCALAAESTVVLATPVDTGRARSNWLAKIDAPAEGTVEPKDPSSAIADAAAVVAAYGPNNVSIHLTNNLPYIQRLNEGWSAQAPAGFVEEAVRAALNSLKNVKVVPQ